MNHSRRTNVVDAKCHRTDQVDLAHGGLKESQEVCNPVKVGVRNTQVTIPEALLDSSETVPWPRDLEVGSMHQWRISIADHLSETIGHET